VHRRFVETVDDARARIAFRVAELVARGSGPYYDVLDHAARIVCEEFADLCLIALLDETHTKLHHLGLHHRDPTFQAELDSLPEFAWEPVDGAFEEVLKSGRPALFNELDADAIARGRWWVTDFLERSHLARAVVLPLYVFGEPVGVMGIAQEASCPPLSEEDARYMQGIGDLLALAIDDLRLREEATRRRGAMPAAASAFALSDLSERELQILRLIGEGLTNREIGERLYLSVRTVEWHRGRIAGKLGVHKRSELIAVGRQAGREEGK
jgi:DNA-binding CsgD family transcriptional regulator